MSPRATLLVPVLLCFGCNVEFGGTPSPTASYPEGTGAYTDDNPEDDDLVITGLVPLDGAEYLPAAFQIVATFSEPYLGKDGDIIGRFGPTCDAGVTLRPQVSDDRTSVAWSMSAEPGGSYCFDLTVIANLTAPPHVSAEWTTGACGVSFDMGRGTRFVSIAGETSAAAPLNAALQSYVYPLLLGFPGLAKDTSFPVTTSAIVGSILQVYAQQGSENVPTGTWAINPVSGASDVLDRCTIDRATPASAWQFTCTSDQLTLPIALQVGSMLNDGTVLQAGSAADLHIANPLLTATVSTAGNFTNLTDLGLSGAISEEELLALANASGDSGAVTEIQRLQKNADTNGDGTLDGYSLVMASQPVWIPTLGCDPTLY